MRTSDYLNSIGVRDLPPCTTPFDPGYDPQTVEQHLRQSAHLMSGLKISMACWQVANEESTREKIASCKRHGVLAQAGGGPLEVAAAQGKISEYLALCADMGFDRIEAGEGFVKNNLNPFDIVSRASDQGLQVQFELGEKHSGEFDDGVVDALIKEGEAWLEAGARQLVIEARESASGVGLFSLNGQLNTRLADRFMSAFDEEHVVYEAPVKLSQFLLIDHFGPSVRLGNVRLEELLRVEIYRRGLHSDAFSRQNLRPRLPDQ